MPRPGSHKYDIKRAKIRKRIEDQGVAADAEADRLANKELQKRPTRRPRRATGRAAGPKGKQ
jgi:hypothetical protein